MWPKSCRFGTEFLKKLKVFEHKSEPSTLRFYSHGVSRTATSLIPVEKVKLMVVVKNLIMREKLFW